MSWVQKWGSSRKVGRELEGDLVSPSDLPLKCRTLSQGGDTLAVTSRIVAAHLRLPALPTPTHTHTPRLTHTYRQLVGRKKM